ncbi:MAG: NAD(+) synthase [Hyphomonadaceae bacterium]|nr:NAD(+) synthase [Hyphomonadaceae bacterium]
MSRASPAAFNFVRVAAATPVARLADPAANAEATLALARACAAEGAQVALFPELGLSGYTLDDLLFQDALLDEVEAAVAALAAGSAGLDCLIVAGAPLRFGDRLFNTAVAVKDGALLGVVPKSYLPTYREFYEKRHFASGVGVVGETIVVGALAAPFGTDLLFQADSARDLTVHIEICEDLWAPSPPSVAGALAGAKILLNLSASDAVIGKAAHRDTLCAVQSSRLAAAYVFSAAGPGESTTDLAWDGQATIHELGERLAASDRFPRAAQFCIADVDLDRLRQERMRLSTWRDAQSHAPQRFRTVPFAFARPKKSRTLARAVPRYPFVPDDPVRLDHDCYEAYNIQVRGLTQRLEATGVKKLVLGVSGGLDSTQALIVAANAMDALGLPRAHILAFTLPGFATGAATKANAAALAKAFNATFEEIDIRPAARQLLDDIGHPAARGETVYDVTFENVQAGLRTDYLFRLANQRGALVLGTGDLSELALGWCTYGVGDHMSHYNVNAGAPKTLIQHLIRWNARRGAFGPEASRLLMDILDTEISPELIPAGADGAMQSTEAAIGPYALHDFFLYYVLRWGFRPDKIAYLAECAWGDVARGAWPDGLPAAERRAFTRAEIIHWLGVFAKRFFETSQFKRSAMPNGPKILAGGSLSPRGDWRAPSDASARVWLDQIARLT